MAKSYTPTEAMRNNAKRGLALREKYNRGGLDASQANKEEQVLLGLEGFLEKKRFSRVSLKRIHKRTLAMKTLYL